MAIRMEWKARVAPEWLDLLLVFSRYEYAIKRMPQRFVQRRRDGSIEVDWDTYANTQLTTAFYVKVRDEGIAPTFFSAPPGREVVGNNAIEWRNTSPPPATVQDLIGMVCRVRNNVFHGGKYVGENRTRQAGLPREATAILLAAVEHDPQLRGYFEGD